jgi:hypothetical protein
VTVSALGGRFVDRGVARARTEWVRCALSADFGVASCASPHKIIQYSIAMRLWESFSISQCRMHLGGRLVLLVFEFKVPCVDVTRVIVLFLHDM